MSVLLVLALAWGLAVALVTARGGATTAEVKLATLVVATLLLLAGK
jgi:hypothetical protein